MAAERFYKFQMPAHAAQWQEERDAQVLRTICGKCGRGKKGTLVTGREWFLEHRMKCAKK